MNDDHRRLALAAAHSAAAAAAELLTFAREGEGPGADTFTSPIDLLLDAAKMAIEAVLDPSNAGEFDQIYTALCNALEGVTT